MGNKNSNSKAKKFFNEIPINNDDEEIKIDIKEKVNLNLFLGNCKQSNEYYIKLFYFNNNQEDFLGETEKIKANKDNIIEFPSAFIIEYFFEKEQKLIFKIYNNEKETIFNTTLGTIVGSRGNTLEKKISDKDNELIKIKSKKYEDSYKGDFDLSSFTHLLIKIDDISPDMTNINQKIKKKSHKIKDNHKFFFKISSSQDVYISEFISLSNSNHFQFNPIRIPLDFLKPSFNIDFINKQNNNTLLKEKYENLDKFFNGLEQQITIKYSPKNVMDLIIHGKLINRKKKNTFLNFLEDGLEIGLGIGIDFTGSSSTLHSGSGFSNQYETAIRLCGNIVAKYDNDQLFPVYGFGASLHNSSFNKMAFPINFNKNDPEIYTIDGVISEYHKCLKKIGLGYPTEYHHIFKYYIDSVIEENNPNKYNILLFLTDGSYDDRQETINEIVRASKLPISIIIIGLGDANFASMEELDGDDEPLKNSKGEKWARDICQFVAFNKYKDDPKLLSEKVLEEIPKQVCDYYNSNLCNI